VTRLHFLQTGGLAGLKMTADLDTADLTPEEATVIDKLVDAALAEAAPPSPDPRVRDDQQYEVTIVRNGERKVLRGSGLRLPAAFRALVAELQKRAEPSR